MVPTDENIEGHKDLNLFNQVNYIILPKVFMTKYATL